MSPKFKNWQNEQWKNKEILSFSSVLALTKIKEYITPCHRIKTVLKNICFAEFRVTDHFLRPCNKLKSNIKKFNFGIGFLKQLWHNMESVNIFFSLQNHSTLVC